MLKLLLRLSSYALLAILVFSCQAKLSKRDQPIASADIDQMVEHLRVSFDAPGLAVGVIKNGKLIYAGANGVQDVASQTPLTPQSLFHMASVSKPFVATAIMQLREQGKLKLEDKLTDHLPYFTMADDRYQNITLRQMLTHSSGMPDEDDYEWDNPQFDDGAAERYAKSFGEAQLEFTPGDGFSYSNPAFDILCDVIAKASGMTFEAYMKENILGPIGMVNSTFYKPEVNKSLATQPHIFNDDLQRAVSEVYPYNRRHAGSSTLHSNVEDMMLWAQVYLNKGVINGQRIFSEDSYDLMTAIQNKTYDKDRSVGLSWFLAKALKSPVVFHSGGDLGYSTFFCFLPERKSALVLMTNVDNFWQEDAAGFLMANVILDRSVPFGRPISYELKDYILKEGIEKTKAVYFDRKENFADSYHLGSGLIDDLGYLLMDKGHPEKALEVFLFNVELEPKDSGWVDSVGDAYVALGDLEQAKAWYEKALEMNPKQGFTREKLEQME